MITTMFGFFDCACALVSPITANASTAAAKYRECRIARCVFDIGFFEAAACAIDASLLTSFLLSKTIFVDGACPDHDVQRRPGQFALFSWMQESLVGFFFLEH